MIKIRLTRMGRKKKPFYRVVAADIRAPRDGKFLEVLGTYDPLAEPGKKTAFKADRVKYWLGVGAQPTETMKRLLRDATILTEKEAPRRTVKKAPKKADEEAA